MKQKKPTTVCRVCGEPMPISGRRVLSCPSCGAKQLSLPDAPEERQTHIADACRYLSRGDFYSALRLFEENGHRFRRIRRGLERERSLNHFRGEKCGANSSKGRTGRQMGFITVSFR